MSDLGQRQIDQLIEGQQSMFRQMAEQDQQRKQQKQQLIIGWIGAITGVAIVCQTLLGAFKESLETTVKMSDESMMIHINNLADKLESFDKKFLKDGEQDREITRNGENVKSNKEAISSINERLRAWKIR